VCQSFSRTVTLVVNLASQDSAKASLFHGQRREEMAYRQRIFPKEMAMDVLRRAGFSEEVINELASQLPDPIDIDRESSLLDRYGITMETLTDRMGGSP
jgi:hypothetical protein